MRTGFSCRTTKDIKEYEQSRTPLLSLETQTPIRDFDVVAFSISFETDYLNMAKMLQMSGIPVWANKRTDFDPIVIMGGAASFLNPEPIADFTDIIAVGEGEILVISWLTRSSNTEIKMIFSKLSQESDADFTFLHFMK